MSFFQIHRDIVPVEPEVVFMVKGFPVTDSFLTIALIVVLFAVLAYKVSRRISILPDKFQNSVETVYEAMFGMVEQITGDKESARAIFPLTGSLFLYIGVSNLLTLFMPGLTSITFHGHPVFRMPTSDFNTTLGLAFAMIFLLQIIGMRHSGVFGYLGRFFQFKQVYEGFRKGLSTGLTSLINFFVGLLEIISEVARVVSLSIRLFGNMYAGEVLIVIMLSIAAYVVPTAAMALGILAGIVQAIVFGSLVTVYYTLAVRHEE